MFLPHNHENCVDYTVRFRSFVVIIMRYDLVRWRCIHTSFISRTFNIVNRNSITSYITHFKCLPWMLSENIVHWILLTSVTKRSFFYSVFSRLTLTSLLFAQTAKKYYFNFSHFQKNYAYCKCKVSKYYKFKAGKYKKWRYDQFTICR